MERMERFLKITFEAMVPLAVDSEELRSDIISMLDTCRAVGAGHVSAIEIVSKRVYEEWYKGPSVHEVEIPTPTIVRFD